MPLVRFSKMSCIASVLATACVGTRGNEGRASKATTVDTEIVFVASDKAAGDFPQVKDSSRILPGGSIQPDLAAPPCPSTTLPDTRTWPRLESPLPLAHFRSVSIRPASWIQGSTNQEKQLGRHRGSHTGFGVRYR